MGDEAGRRVFAVIIAMCNKPTSERDAQDGMTLSFRAGMRHVADLITMHMSEITKEPKVERQDSNNG